ncbi:MAG: SRPBCC domain-containing protein [Pseudomonadota bacterium]|nr:SRPBCC domain-containing protein [Pseudomonadota bacterium]
MTAAAPKYAYGTFTLERRWATTPARVFEAWADADIKALWFPGVDEETMRVVRRDLDLRRGGIEVLEGKFHASGMTAIYEARYHLVEPNRRLVYDYDLHHDDRFHSVTLSSLFIEPDGAHTRVAYTEQIVFLNGEDGTASRRHGTELQWEKLETVMLRAGTA